MYSDFRCLLSTFQKLRKTYFRPSYTVQRNWQYIKISTCTNFFSIMTIIWPSVKNMSWIFNYISCICRPLFVIKFEFFPFIFHVLSEKMKINFRKLIRILIINKFNFMYFCFSLYLHSLGESNKRIKNRHLIQDLVYQNS